MEDTDIKIHPDSMRSVRKQYIHMVWF